MSNDSGNVVDNVDDKQVISNQRQQQQQPHVKTKRQDTIHRYQGTGMTPSIITTINNTSPTLPVNHSTAVNSNNNNNSISISNSNNNNNNNSINHVRGNNTRRTTEPYESYIEDSFVGHWEHEDDMDEYQEEFDAESHDGCDDPDHSDLQHPSTIEFDFDSFGPESIIYTPTAAAQVNTSPTATTANSTITATTTTTTTTPSAASSRPEPLVEVSPEAEKAHETTEQLSEEMKKVMIISDNHPTPTSDPQNSTALSNNIATTTTTFKQYSSSGPILEFIVRPPTFHPYSSHDYLVDPAQIDLRVIEPYKKVISHAGYCHHFDQSAPPNQQTTTPTPGEQAPAVIVFSACYLPDRSRSDYNYVMDHLFFYVLTSLHELIADDYILIYLHNTQPSGKSSSSSSSNSSSGTTNRGTTANGSATPNLASNESQNSNNLPTFTWMKRCYQMIDRRLRKNLKILYLVKPTFWLKTIVIMCKPFISTKFSKKLKFVEDMDGLRKCLPVEKLILPASAENL